MLGLSPDGMSEMAFLVFADAWENKCIGKLISSQERECLQALVSFSARATRALGPQLGSSTSLLTRAGQSQTCSTIVPPFLGNNSARWSHFVTSSTRALYKCYRAPSAPLLGRQNPILPLYTPADIRTVGNTFYVTNIFNALQTLTMSHNAASILRCTHIITHNALQTTYVSVTEMSGNQHGR